jgi:FKBP-type peptidyl-prolyl cis-trans isomerase
VTRFLAALLLVAGVGAACGGDSPAEPVWEVIETSEYPGPYVNEALDTFTVNLAQMTEHPSGVWYEDLVVGVGDTVGQNPDRIYIHYAGWLRDGTLFDDGEFDYEWGNQTQEDGALAGIQLGMLGQIEGGSRLLLVPPEWGYGSLDFRPDGPIYPGAILIFHVQLDSIVPALF